MNPPEPHLPSAAPSAAQQSAQRHIRALLARLDALARRDVPENVFWSEFLQAELRSLGAVAAVVWTAEEPQGNDPPRWSVVACEGHGGTPPAITPEFAERHGRLIEQAARKGHALAIRLDATRDNTESAIPGGVLVSPVLLEGRTRHVVEILEPASQSPQTQQGYLRFLDRASDLASDYLLRRAWRASQRHAAARRPWDDFQRALYAQRAVRGAAYTLANEGRRLMDADRVSVAIGNGNQCRVIAISGQDTFDARSNAVQALERLAADVLAAGAEVWSDGDASVLPAPLDASLPKCLDQSQARWIGVLPLTAAARGETVPAGAIIVELFSLPADREGLQERSRDVAAHGGVALSNAVEIEQSAWGRAWSRAGLGTGSRLSRAGIIVSVAALAGAIIVLAPVDFSVSCSGALEPSVRRNVFAPIDGQVRELQARHGQIVEAGQALVELHNTDLDVAIADLTGSITATREQLVAVDRSLFDEQRALSAVERNRLAGEQAVLKQRLESLESQLSLQQARRAQLKVTSPIRGEVTTWDIERRLAQRPVRQGQVLLSVADTDAPWEVELRIPERDVGHLLAAQRAAGTERIGVEFRSATDPTRMFRGEIVRVERAADVHGEEGNSVRAIVAIQAEDEAELRSADLLRPGADVMAKLDCGRASLAYAWFHEPWAWLRSRLWQRVF